MLVFYYYYLDLFGLVNKMSHNQSFNYHYLSTKLSYLVHYLKLQHTNLLHLLTSSLNTQRIFSYWVPAFFLVVYCSMHIYYPVCRNFPFLTIPKILFLANVICSSLFFLHLHSPVLSFTGPKIFHNIFILSTNNLFLLNASILNVIKPTEYCTIPDQNQYPFIYIM